MDILDKLSNMQSRVEAYQEVWGESHPLFRQLDEALSAVYQELFVPPSELAAFGVTGEVMPVSGKEGLAGWQEESLLRSRMFEPGIRASLYQLAQIADRLSRPPYSIPVFLPEVFALTESGEWAMDWPVYSMYQLKPGQTKLTTAQRNARYVMHPGLTRSLPEPFAETIPAAMAYSFGMFLLGLCLRASSAFVQNQASQYIRYVAPEFPPEWPYLFHGMLQNGSLSAASGRMSSCASYWTKLEEALLLHEQAKQHTPDLSVVPHLASCSVSGRQKPGPMQDVELTSPVNHLHLCLTGVADGMSHAELGSGEVAARECARAFEEVALRYAHELLDAEAWPVSSQEFQERVFAQANESVTERCNLYIEHGASVDGEDCAPMATTMLTATVLGDAAYIAWLGDSVAWHYQAETGCLIRLTVPHHEFQRRLQKEPCEALEAALASDRRLYRHIGLNEWEGEGGLLEPATVSPSSLVRVFAPGDLLLLASDGLVEGSESKGWMEADAALEAEIRSFGASIERLHELAYHLVQSADVSDGRDNITLVVVGFVQQQTEDKAEEKAPCGLSDEVSEVLDPLDDTEVEVVSRPSSSERKSQKKSKTTSRRRTKSSTRSRSSQKKSV